LMGLDRLGIRHKAVRRPALVLNIDLVQRQNSVDLLRL
jgi:hypothetical protein